MIWHWNCCGMGLLPRYKLMEKCLDRYRSSPNPSNIMIENLLYALRVDTRISTWPDEISHMRSSLSEPPVDTLGLDAEEEPDGNVVRPGKC